MNAINFFHMHIIQSLLAAVEAPGRWGHISYDICMQSLCHTAAISLYS